MPVPALIHPVAVYMSTFNCLSIIYSTILPTRLALFVFTSKLLPIAPSPGPSGVAAIAACVHKYVQLNITYIPYILFILCILYVFYIFYIFYILSIFYITYANKSYSYNKSQKDLDSWPKYEANCLE